jgi:hypothetical protein
MTELHRVTVRKPADLLAAVPYLLGFHPTDSVVALALRGTRVIFQARADAPDPAEVDGLADYLAQIIVRQEPTSAIVIGYGPEASTAGALAALRAALASVGVPVVDALRVHEGRYWSLSCPKEACCPVDGIPYDPAATALAASAAFGGLAPLPDRAALVGTLAPVPGPGLEPETARAEERLAGFLRPGSARKRRTAARTAVREALERHAAGGRLDDDEVAWLAVLVDDRRARDDAWQRMLAVAPRDEHTALWRDVVRRVPKRYVPAPATLLALVEWRAGNGPAAGMAVDRALDADPGYPLAGLVRQALTAAVPPDLLDERPPSSRRRRAPRMAAPRLADDVRTA